MDSNKIGHFIKELRKEKGLSQTKLAEMIPITRQAISNWETGKASPDSQVMIILSKIFDVSIDEIIVGRRLKKEEEKTVKEEIKLALVDENNNQKRKIYRLFKLFILVIIIFIILFLSYYFFTNYNSIKVYRIDGYNDKFITKKGLLIKTKQKSYIRLGKIENINKDTVINKVELYYISNKKEKIIFSDENTDVTYTETYGYNDKSIRNNYLKKLYLKIYYDDSKTSIIKLKIEKDFSNILLSYDKKNEAGKNKPNKKNNDDSNIKKAIEIIKSNSESQEEDYKLEFKENDELITITYTKSNILIVRVDKSSASYQWIYFENHNNLLNYREIIDMKENKFIEIEINNLSKDKETAEILKKLNFYLEKYIINN